MKPTPPILPAPPLIGHLLDFSRDRRALLQRGYQTLGPVFTLKMGPKPIVVLIGPEYHEVFFAETDKSLRMDKAYTFLRAMFGDVAFTAPPETYFAQRPILHAPFKREKMIGYLPIMQHEVQTWIDSLGESGEFALVKSLTQVVQNVAAHTLMGRDFREKAGQEFWDLYAVLGAAMDPVLPPNLPLPKFWRRDRAKAQLRTMIRPILAERRAQPERYDDFLQEFVNARYKDGTPMDDESIISIILALMFAGHETTVGQASWTVIQLLQNPAYQADLQQELDAHLPPGTPIDADAFKELPRLAWAIDETTRMHPSADMMMRGAVADLEVGDYRIPAGWMAMLAPGIAHYLPEWFDDPERYDPCRFSPERAEHKKHRFAMIGFGGGIHKCAGMNFANNEMAIITALLFQQLELELVTPEPTVIYGLGAGRPSETIIRYQRKTVQETD